MAEQKKNFHKSTTAEETKYMIYGVALVKAIPQRTAAESNVKINIKTLEQNIKIKNTISWWW